MGCARVQALPDVDKSPHIDVIRRLSELTICLQINTRVALQIGNRQG